MDGFKLRMNMGNLTPRSQRNLPLENVISLLSVSLIKNFSCHIVLVFYHLWNFFQPLILVPMFRWVKMTN